MEPSKDRLKEEKKETISSKYSIGTKAYNNINKRPNHNSTLSFSSRYKKNSNITSSQINKSKDNIQEEIRDDDIIELMKKRLEENKDKEIANHDLIKIKLLGDDLDENNNKDKINNIKYCTNLMTK